MPNTSDLMRRLGQGEAAPRASLDESVKALALPRKIDRYIAYEVLGVGGMGVVYQAYDTRLRRSVALKAIRSGSDTDLKRRDQLHARLEREALAMAKISHANVVVVHDVGIWEDDVYVVMDLVSGETLTDWLASGRTWQEVVRAFIMAGRGLEAAHATGLVHRDFKPDNVLVAADGAVKVSDFGLVRELDEPKRSAPTKEFDLSSGSRADAYAQQEVTARSAVVGTFPYMSPEQCREDVVDARADQFSFCVALYEALYSSRHPLVGQGSSDPRVDESQPWILNAPDESPDCPRELWPIIERGLQRDRDERWPSMVELLTQLGNVANKVNRSSRLPWLMAALAGTTALAAIALSLHTTPEVKHEDGTLCARGDMLATTAFEEQGLYLKETERLSPWAQVASSYRKRWSDSYQTICEATHSQLTQSESDLNGRMACLHKRLDRAVMILAQLKSDTRSVPYESLSRALGDPEYCITWARSDDFPIEPPDAATPLISAVRDEMEALRTRGYLGDYAGALADLKPLRERISALSYQPLEAEYEFLRGVLLVRLGQADEADEALIRTVELSASSSHFWFSAQANIERVWLGGELKQRPVASQIELERHSQTLVALLRRPQLRIRLLNAQAVSRMRGDDNARREAIALYQTAHKELDLWPHEVDPTQRSILLNNLGNVLRRSRRHEEAMAYYEQALAQSREQLGEMHPLTLSVQYGICNYYHEKERFVTAEACHRKVLELRRRTLPPEHYEIGSSLGNLGNTLHAQCKWAEAEEVLSESVRIAKNGKHPNLDLALSTLALVQMHGNDPTIAIGTARQAIETALNEPRPDPVVLTVLNNTLGEAMREAGMNSEAEAQLLRTLEMADKLGPNWRQALRGDALTALGALYLMSGDHEPAYDYFSQADQAREDDKPSPAFSAVTSALFARARWHARGDSSAIQVARESVTQMKALHMTRCPAYVTTLEWLQGLEPTPHDKTVSHEAI